MGQDEVTAARRVNEVNQINLHERRELREIQFEQELSLHLSYWEQEEAAAATAPLQAAESRYAQAATSRLLMGEEKPSDAISIYGTASLG